MKRPNVTFVCEYCGKTVQTYRSPSALRSTPPRFCSLRCIGRAQVGNANPSYSGGRHVLSIGYVVVLMPDHPDADVRGYVLEHRLVMERHIGRRLVNGEIVHHINGLRDDNRIENLELMSSHEEHLRLHHHPPIGKQLSGESHPMAILKEKDVVNIRSRVESGECQRRLAEEFMVSASTISNIIKRKTWNKCQSSTK